jgi:hypothetical protein
MLSELRNVKIIPSLTELKLKLISRLILSKGPNRVGVSLPSPEDRNRSSFRNIVFSRYLKFREMMKDKNPINSECCTP